VSSPPKETQRIVSEGVEAIQAAHSQALPSTYDFATVTKVWHGGPAEGWPAWSKSHAGVGDWKSVWLMRDLWHSHFYGETHLALVKGRERTYFEHFFKDFAVDRTHSVPEADRSCSIIEESYCENSALLLATSSLTVRIFWT
jgi:hypothetical protein